MLNELPRLLVPGTPVHPWQNTGPENTVTSVPLPPGFVFLPFLKVFVSWFCSRGNGPPPAAARPCSPFAGNLRRRLRLVQPVVCGRSATIRGHLKPRTIRGSRKPAGVSTGSAQLIFVVAGPAQPVRSGARAGDNAHHEGACRGRCECGVELRPLHHGGDGADNIPGTAGHGGGFNWLGDWVGVRDAPSPSSVVPAGPVQPWGGFRFSGACSSPAPSGACSSPAPSSACTSPVPSSACTSPVPSSACTSPAPSGACSSPAPSSACSETAPSSACSETAPSSACTSPVPSSACTSPVPSSACTSPVPSSACTSPVPSSACSSPAPSSAGSS